MSPTGRFLAITGDGKTVSFFDSKTTNRCGPDLRVESRIGQVTWSSTEDHIVTNSYDGILRKWSNIFESPTLVAQSSQEHREAALEFSPDDRIIASFRRGLKLWDASNLSLIWEYPGYWCHVAFHPLGNRIVFYSSGSYLPLDVNIEDLGNITATKLEFNGVHSLVFDPCGNMCVARTFEGAKILSADTFEEKSSLPYDDCSAMQITPNEKYILLLLESKKVVLWDIAAEEAVEELSLDAGEFYTGEISWNCRVLHLWNYGDDEQIIHLASTYY